MITIRNYILDKIIANKTFIICAICIFSMRWSFADHYRVPTGSMIPTIQIGDHVFVNKMAYDLKLPFTDIILTETGVPRRGDIIVFKYPKDPSLNYVKRLIAVPGDHVVILNGFVKVNGKVTLQVPEQLNLNMDMLLSTNVPFGYFETLGDKSFTIQRLPQYSREHRLSFTVPKERYFFMGDNRDNSADSRSWGFVPRNHLKGQVKNVTMSVAFDGIIPKINFFRFGKALI